MSAKTKKEAGFETNMHKLQALVEKLEGENLSLEDSLGAFEQACALAKLCETQLQSAQERISVLTEGKERELTLPDDDAE